MSGKIHPEDDNLVYPFEYKDDNFTGENPTQLRPVEGTDSPTNSDKSLNGETSSESDVSNLIPVKNKSSFREWLFKKKQPQVESSPDSDVSDSKQVQNRFFGNWPWRRKRSQRSQVVPMVDTDTSLHEEPYSPPSLSELPEKEISKPTQDTDPLLLIVLAYYYNEAEFTQTEIITTIIEYIIDRYYEYMQILLAKNDELLSVEIGTQQDLKRSYDSGKLSTDEYTLQHDGLRRKIDSLTKINLKYKNTISELSGENIKEIILDICRHKDDTDFCNFFKSPLLTQPILDIFKTFPLIQDNYIFYRIPLPILVLMIFLSLMWLKVCNATSSSNEGKISLYTISSEEDDLTKKDLNVIFESLIAHNNGKVKQESHSKIQFQQLLYKISAILPPPRKPHGSHGSRGSRGGKTKKNKKQKTKNKKTQKQKNKKHKNTKTQKHKNTKTKNTKTKNTKSKTKKLKH